MFYKKIKILTEKFGKFLREIAIIVIGVTITLSASYWISDRNTKKDTALYLDAIKLELEENKRFLEETDNDFIRLSMNYSDYLRSYNSEALSLDSLLFYRYHIIFNVFSITVKINAFDMFKTSGNMRLVKNKAMLLSLWDSYTQLIELKRFFETTHEMKLDEMKKYVYLNSLPDEEILRNPPMYNYYVNMNVPSVQKNFIDNSLKAINKTLSMME